MRIESRPGVECLCGVLAYDKTEVMSNGQAIRTGSAARIQGTGSSGPMGGIRRACTMGDLRAASSSSESEPSLLRLLCWALNAARPSLHHSNTAIVASPLRKRALSPRGD